MCNGKNFCKFEHKWCKYCKTTGCAYNRKQGQYSDFSTLNTCPKRQENRTISLYEILCKTDINKVLDYLFLYYPKEMDNLNGYKKVYYELFGIKPVKYPSVIHCKLFQIGEGEIFGFDVYGVEPSCPNGAAMEFVPWCNWLYMNVSQETLDKYSYDAIVAMCLYEMTFCGFSEQKIQGHYDDMLNNLHKMINEQDKY